LRYALFLGLLLLLTTALPVRAFEPDELLQWDQEERLRGEISLRYLMLNSQTVQINRGGPNALSKFDARFQYRLFENPGWGKFECYLGFSLLTHWDVFDRLDFAQECGYTFEEAIRLEIGHLQMLNIGASNRGRGLSSYWVGGSGRVLATEPLKLDGYLRYFFDSNLPAAIQKRLESAEEALTLESGLRIQYRLLPSLTLFGAPYLYFDDSLSLARVGVYHGIRYQIGEHLHFLPRSTALELGGNFAANTDFDRKETVGWFRLIWTWK